MAFALMLLCIAILPLAAESGSTILITGPSGTGKELFARSILDDMPVPVDPSDAVANMRVRRPMSLVGNPSVVDDPRCYLEARAESSSVTIEGDRYVVALHTGGRVVFAATPISGGWSLRREDGPHPWSAIALVADGKNVELMVELYETVDPMAPGMRGRVAFDLQADLVALSQKT